MRTAIATLAIAMVLTGCAAGGSSAKERLKSLLVAKFERDGASLFNEDSRIPEADRPRAVHCVLDAMLADMSNAQAKRLADMIEQKIPPEQAFILYWIAPRESGNAERAAQIESRAQEICPDLAGKLL